MSQQKDWNKVAQDQVRQGQQMSNTHNMSHQDRNAYETAYKQAQANANQKK